MRKIISLTFLISLLVIKVIASDEPDFKHHTFELSVAAGMDHQFVVGKYKDPVTAQLLKDAERPFAGFCFGVQYIYRPIRMIGISTGFESLEYGNRIGTYWDGPYTPTSVYHGFGFDGSIGVPFYVHYYRQISRITVELATGPEFFFEVYSMEKYQVNYYADPFEPPVSNFHNTQYLNSSQIKQNSSLAWSVQLMVNIPVTHVFGISIGPEWKFLDLASLSQGSQTDFSVPRAVPFFLGVKAGFCFGSNFWKKTG